MTLRTPLSEALLGSFLLVMALYFLLTAIDGDSTGVVVVGLGIFVIAGGAGVLLATLAEYERELIVERVNAGITAARESGTRFGRPPVNPDAIAEKLAIVTDARDRGRTAAEAAALVGWSRATLYRHQRTVAVVSKGEH
jgi:DNA invertase Pin-like site-specific DNA recombinase